MVMLGIRLSTAMNARLIGSGDESLILGHGFGGNQSVWDKIIPELTQRFRVLVFDWSFSGAVKDPTLFDSGKYCSYESFADDLIELVEEMKVGPAVFCGHSMAGMIGGIASIKRPDLFKRLILIGASPRYINTEDYEGGFDNSDIEQILSSIESNFPKWASSFAPLVVDTNDPHSVEKFVNSMKTMRPEVALSVAKIVFLCDERDILDKINTPCTIIQTTNDIAVPASVADYMKKRMKGESTVEIMDINGHFPQLTAHIQLLEVLGRILGF